MTIDDERLEELLRANPKVDAMMIRRVNELVEELLSHGLPAPRYDLVSPHDKRPPQRRGVPTRLHY
jgi:hypothetical protein